MAPGHPASAPHGQQLDKDRAINHRHVDLYQNQYSAATLQFSRGCPYRCEFCDIIVMFGRKPRYKGVEQIGIELDALRRLGQRNVFFVDDNMIGHRAAARELLRYLAEYQRKHDYAFRFGTEVSLNLVPKRMPYESMIDAYESMYRRLVSDRVIAERIRNKLQHIPAPLYSGEYSFMQCLPELSALAPLPLRRPGLCRG